MTAFNLQMYLEQHPESEISGEIKTGSEDEWGIDDPKLKRFFPFQTGDQFKIISPGRLDECVFKGNWYEDTYGAYVCNGDTLELGNIPASSIGKLTRTISTELHEYIEDHGTKRETIGHVITRLEELGYSLFDCVSIHSKYSQESDRLNVRGASFLMFANTHEGRFCNLTHQYLYDDRHEDEGPSFDKFIFTTSSGDSYTYVYEFEIDKIEHFADGFLDFSKQEIHFDTSADNWESEYQHKQEDMHEYIFSYDLHPSRGSVSNYIDYILLGTDRGIIGVSMHNYVKRLIAVKEDVELTRFQSTDYENLAIRGLFFETKTNTYNVFLDYLIECDYDHQSISEHEIEKAFANHDKLSYSNIKTHVKVYRGVNLESQSEITDDKYYKRVRKAFGWL